MKEETMDALERYIDLKWNDALSVEENANTKNAHHDYMEALEALRNIEKDQNDFYDKQEKRRIDEERNQENADLEREKSKIGWKRMTLEVLKIFVPSMMAAGAAIWMQSKAGRLEETGRWTTEAGRQAHRQVPNIWKS